ncbi:hypothetical protein [Janthinobacterium sp. RB2R34]|uniref:hypothetical protein n=1 Tax=Janthinobacterium sp. RB2R34 TaxID=3424193 RepID=UPI003F24BC0C
MKKIENGHAYFDGAPAVGGTLRPAIWACRQAGHQQPMAAALGTGTETTGGMAVHQQGSLASGSSWPQQNCAPQSVHWLMIVNELITVACISGQTIG